MVTRPRNLTVVLSAGVLLSSGATQTTATPHRALGPQQWVARYEGPFNNPDYAQDVAVAPDGSMVFVTGGGATADPDESDFATLAYEARSGNRLWLARYDGPGDGFDSAAAVAVSPDGSRVFVTGRSDGPDFMGGWATVAYDATAGGQLWVSRIDNPSTFIIGGPDSIQSSPDGSTVFVTGAGANLNGAPAWITVAYDAVTGEEHWIRYLSFSGGGLSDLAVSPDGGRVYVSGTAGRQVFTDIAVVAFDAATGGRVAGVRYSSPGQSQDVAYAVGVSPDGSKVVVTGEGAAHFVTLAYSADLSARLWVSDYDPPDTWTDVPYALAISPDSARVSVTGLSLLLSDQNVYATVTYDAATGAEYWAARYGESAIAHDVAYQPDGALLFVTGESLNDGTMDYVTVTYDPSTGQQLKVAALDGPEHASDLGIAMAVSPVGTQVFVTGWIDLTNADYPPTDYGTVAYGIG